MAISKLNYNSLNVTPSANSAIGFGSGADDLETGSGGGDMVFIKKLTASSSGTLSFVDGASSVVLDSTYKEYMFIFNNMHPATDNVNFTFQGNAAGGSGYNETITSTWFVAYHDEADSATSLEYNTGNDLAQSTSFQILQDACGNDNDQSLAGYLHLFNPSSTTFVKHFIARCNRSHQADYTGDAFCSGYFNTTSAIDEIQFKMSSGNIDSGTITLYGIN
jgi:hypothetical protein